MPNKYQDVEKRFHERLSLGCSEQDSFHDWGDDDMPAEVNWDNILKFILSELTLATTSAVQEYKDRVMGKVEKAISEITAQDDSTHKLTNRRIGYRKGLQQSITLIKEE